MLRDFTELDQSGEKITNKWPGCCHPDYRNSMARRAQYCSWVVVAWSGDRWQCGLAGVSRTVESQSIRLLSGNLQFNLSRG